MADTNRTQPDPNEPSSYRDQAAERENFESERDRGYDETTRAREGSSDEQFEDIDPDSPQSDVDRDDTIDEP